VHVHMCTCSVQGAGTPVALRVQHMSTFRRARVFLALLAGLAASTATAQQPALLDPTGVQAAIDRALRIAPRGFEALLAPAQTGVRVVDVDVERAGARRQRVTIDLSQKTLTYDPAGDVEALLDTVVRSTAPLTAGASDVEYRFLIDGLPLDQFLENSSRVDSRQIRGSGSGPMVVSAGHGWYWHEGSASWRLQRDYFWGIVEDFVNWEFAQYVREELSAAGFVSRSARQPDRGAPQGASGHPGWQEAAVYFLRALGAPPAVWSIGATDYNRDINSRPFYANWIDAAGILSIHSNGGGGTGTETWYDTSNEFEAASARLASIVNAHVVSAIRAHYNPAWPDRGLRSCNGCKGETRLALRPAVILEVAFMDTRSPDNDALRDDRFKRIVARAIRDALLAWAAADD
jgi:N-acetylmuramoyl-L-alanine amidase